MVENAVERRLAAVLAADVVGYSRLMGENEAGTLLALKALRTEVLDPKIAEHKGRVFKTLGDGVLVEFPSVVNAVACAVDIQRGMQARNSDIPEDEAVRLRIGVNLGDVIVEEDDIFGDGVNVAARLEGIAPPGGVAVSGTVRDHLGNRLDLQLEDIGERVLKNIERPVRVCLVKPGRGPAGKQPKLSLPDKPSIAVLPFTNMSDDSEQGYFADGLTEDLITDLSRNSGLFVIARNSTFAYKGKSVDARRIASDLGVRYLLEGSARRSAGRVRINVQLIDANGGGHLWAERFDRNVDDIFAVQDEVTARIVEALVGRLTVLPPPRNRPADIRAYDLCVRARAIVTNAPASLEAMSEARVLLHRTIALDPGYAEPYRWLAFNLWCAWSTCTVSMEPSRSESLKAAEKAVELDPNDAGARSVLGLVLAYERRWTESDSEFAAALSLDPSNADAWMHSAEIAAFGGRPETGIEHAQKSLRLNPLGGAWYYWELGLAQYAARRYEEAVTTLRQDAIYRTGARRILAASLAQLGRIEEASEEATLFMANSPHFSSSHWASMQPFRDEAMRAHFVDGYRKAGLPE